MIESGSEFSHFTPESINFSDVIRLSEDIKKPWLKDTLKKIKILIKNKTNLVQDTEKGEPVTPYMDVCKSKIQSDGSIDKLYLRILVRGDLHNKKLFGFNWSPTVSKRIVK